MAFAAWLTGCLTRLRGPTRRRVPTVLQMEAVECGAASLAMVLARFGRWVPLEELRYRCGVSRDGTRASNLVKAAGHYGLRAKGFSREPGDLATLPLPQILFWNFNHFVVLWGIGRDRMHINDPASGPRTIPVEEFERGFTGVTLCFEPGEGFERGGRRPSVVAGLLERLRGSRETFVFIVLVSLLLVVPGVLVPGFARVFVDYYLVQRFEDWLAPLLLGMAATAVVRGAVTAVQEHYLLRLQTKIAVAASARFMWRILRLPVSFFAQRYAGEVGSRVMLNNQIAGTITGPLATTLLSLLTMIVYAVVMLHYDPVLTAVGVGFAVVNLLLLRQVAHVLADGSRRLLMDQGKLQATALQGLSQIDSYKASGTEALLFRRWTGAYARVVNAEQDLGRVRCLLEAAPVFLSGLMTTSILVVGAARVMDGSLTIGMLVAFSALMAMFNTPVASLVALGSGLQTTAGSLLRADDLLRHPVAPEFSAPDAAAVPRPLGQLTVRGLAFGYSPLEPALLQDIQLEAAPGDRIAVVGGSGSGKSTLGRLLLGLLEPWAGEVRVDGVPLAKLPRAALRSTVALVEQHPVMFADSVRNNLSVWDSTASDEAIIGAAKDAMIHDEITRRPGGYDGSVGEGGHDFSGGQGQRLAIARALVGNPGILVLDEGTSALDAATEMAVLDNLRRRGCTCILITHRPSAIRSADAVIVLEGGRIVQRGRHPELMSRDGPYRRLMAQG